MTPLDLERTYGMTEGNIFHGDLNIEQLFFMRPLPGWADYRSPIEGLYLCGAGVHPGGGVTGAPGYMRLAPGAARPEEGPVAAGGDRGPVPALRPAAVHGVHVRRGVARARRRRRRGGLRPRLPAREPRGPAARALVPRDGVPDLDDRHPRHAHERGRAEAWGRSSSRAGRCRSRTGDTVASALYRAGVRTFSRSLKYHRRRGLYCGTGDCPNCLMTVDGLPAVHACTTHVRARACASSARADGPTPIATCCT